MSKSLDQAIENFDEYYRNIFKFTRQYCSDDIMYIDVEYDDKFIGTLRYTRDEFAFKFGDHAYVDGEMQDLTKNTGIYIMNGVDGHADIVKEEDVLKTLNKLIEFYKDVFTVKSDYRINNALYAEMSSKLLVRVVYRRKNIGNIVYYKGPFVKEFKNGVYIDASMEKIAKEAGIEIAEKNGRAIIVDKSTKEEQEKLTSNLKPIKEDPVNHPSHYTSGGIEVHDFISAWHMNFDEGNVIKYVTRAPYKGKEVEDLKKARWYLDKLIEEAEKSEQRLKERAEKNANR